MAVVQWNSYTRHETMTTIAFDCRMSYSTYSVNVLGLADLVMCRNNDLRAQVEESIRTTEDRDWGRIEDG